MLKTYRRPGWKYESHRHYLAAKGIKSTPQKYMAGDSAQRTAHFLQSMFDDGRAKTEDFAEQRKMQEVDKLRDDVVEELRREENKGEITFENGQRFLETQFTDETKDFIDGKIDLPKYKANVYSRLEKHKQTHKTTLNLNMFGGKT